MFLVWLAYYREVAIGSLFIKKKGVRHRSHPFFIFFETSFGTRQHTRQKIVKDRK